MVIERYKTGEESRILQLFEKAFHKSLSLDFWKWRFANNPFLGSVMTNLMWENEELIGHYAVSATEIIVDGACYLACLSGTTMTDPAHNGKGIFSKLALHLYERIAKDFNIAMVMGFPNKNSHWGLVKNIGWQDVAIIPTLNCNAERFMATEDKQLRTISEFNIEHEEFAGNCIQETGLSVYVNKSAKYLNWRYIANPDNNYLCLELRQGNQLAGIIVGKVLHSFREEGKREIDILEIFCSANIGTMETLCSGLLSHASLDDAYISSFNMWMSVMDAKHLLAEKLGFVPGLPLHYFCAKNLALDEPKIFSFNNWYYSLGDSDVF